MPSLRKNDKMERPHLWVGRPSITRCQFSPSSNWLRSQSRSQQRFLWKPTMAMPKACKIQSRLEKQKEKGQNGRPYDGQFQVSYNADEAPMTKTGRGSADRRTDHGAAPSTGPTSVWSRLELFDVGGRRKCVLAEKRPGFVQPG